MVLIVLSHVDLIVQLDAILLVKMYVETVVKVTAALIVRELVIILVLGHASPYLVKFLNFHLNKI